LNPEILKCSDGVRTALPLGGYPEGGNDAGGNTADIENAPCSLPALALAIPGIFFGSGGSGGGGGVRFGIPDAESGRKKGEIHSTARNAAGSRTMSARKIIWRDPR